MSHMYTTQTPHIHNTYEVIILYVNCLNNSINGYNCVNPYYYLVEVFCGLTVFAIKVIDTWRGVFNAFIFTYSFYFFL